MLKIQKLAAKLADTNKQILKEVSLEVESGKVYVIRGRNGSGKSTLASVISGHPDFEVTSGDILIESDSFPEHINQAIFEKDQTPKEFSLLELDADKRSLAGVFLANQYPMAIPGVNLSNFLRLAYNARQPEDMPVFKFRKLLKERASIINYPEHLLDRNLNEGFSGGEKKKTEILQLALLEPKYVILDETDSGLDQHAIKDVFMGIQRLRETILPDLALIIITHYEKVLDYIKPDVEREMIEGTLK